MDTSLRTSRNLDVDAATAPYRRSPHARWPTNWCANVQRTSLSSPDGQIPRPRGTQLDAAPVARSVAQGGGHGSAGLRCVGTGAVADSTTRRQILRALVGAAVGRASARLWPVRSSGPDAPLRVRALDSHCNPSCPEHCCMDGKTCVRYGEEETCCQLPCGKGQGCCADGRTCVNLGR